MNIWLIKSTLYIKKKKQHSPRDLEDLVKLGNDLKSCPYYASRTAVKRAQVINIKKKKKKRIEISLLYRTLILNFNIFIPSNPIHNYSMDKKYN